MNKIAKFRGPLLLVLVATVSVRSDEPAPASRPARPNVVLICLEGVPAQATGFGGHPVVKTPRMDALAAHSVQFTRAYTPIPQSAGCRASILTGRYPHVHGVTNDNTAIPQRVDTVSAIFDRAGYTCGLVGTWRLPQPSTNAPSAASNGGSLTHAAAGPNPPGVTAGPNGPQSGIMHPPETPVPGRGPAAAGAGAPHRPMQPGSGPTTRPMGLTATAPTGSMPATTPSSVPASAPTPALAAPTSPPPPPPVERAGLGFDYSATSALGGPLRGAPVFVDGQRATAEKYLPDWHAERAIEFIGKHKEKPFFLALFLPGPGEPLDYPPGKEDLYPPAQLSLPPQGRTDPSNVPIKLKTAPLLQRHPKTPDLLRQSRSKYYAFVTQIDEKVGQVLDALRDAGIEENTLVIVTSDQGFAMGQKDAWGTGPGFWEELIRCPLLVRLPTGFAGSRGTPATATTSSPADSHSDNSAFAPRAQVDRIVSLLDLAPTMLEVAGLRPNPEIQGRSLVPLAVTGHDPYRANECFIQYEQCGTQLFPARVLVSEQYKFVDYLQDADLFYDLKRDPHEEQNRVNETAYASVVKVMRSRLDQWRKRVRDNGSK